MLSVVLLMLAGGIGLMQAVSDPRQVTGRWLWLGGIIATCLVAIAVTADLVRSKDPLSGALVVVAVPFVVQALAAARARAGLQRWASVIGYFAACATIVLLLWGSWNAWPLAESAPGPLPMAMLVLTVALASGVGGGLLMAMLLGHAYLTAGGTMTQAPFLRLVVVLGVLLALRGAAALSLGLVPWLGRAPEAAIGSQVFGGGSPAMWNTLLVTVRIVVGLLVPSVFLYMTYDCVRRRANQSATGILYVASVLALLGEGTALALYQTTGCLF